MVPRSRALPRFYRISSAFLFGNKARLTLLGQVNDSLFVILQAFHNRFEIFQLIIKIRRPEQLYVKAVQIAQGDISTLLQVDLLQVLQHALLMQLLQQWQ